MVQRFVFVLGVLVTTVAFLFVPEGSQAYSSGEPTGDACATFERVGGMDGDWSTIAVSGTTVYAGGEDGLAIIDASTPTTPTLQGSLPITDVEDIAVSGSLAYVISGREASVLKIVDVENPTKPVEHGAYTNEEFQSLKRVAVVGRYVYLTGQATGSANAALLILDIQNAKEPTLVGRYDVGSVPAIAAVEVVGDIAYVARVFDRPVGVLAIDIQEPSHPTLLYSFAPGATFSLESNSNRLYVGGSDSGGGPAFRIFDTLGSPEPRVIYYSETFYTSYRGIDYSRPLIYATSIHGRDSRIVYVDIFDERELTRHGPCASYRASKGGGGYYIEADVVGNMVYVISQWQGLDILRVTSTYLELYLPVVQR